MVTYGLVHFSSMSMESIQLPVSDPVLTLNSEINSSGYQRPDPSFDIFTVSLPVKKATSVVEQFTISVQNIDSNVVIAMEWDKVTASVTIEI